MSDTAGTAVAIICGAGAVPLAVAAGAVARGRRAVLFPLRGWADPADYQGPGVHWLSIGQLGRFIRLAHREGCHDVVLIGSLVRPRLTQLRFDWGSVLMLPRIISAYRGGDDHILSGVGRLGESFGFRVVGAHEVAPDILVPAGRMGVREPSDRDRGDIARALALLSAMGPFDVGQAVVIADGHPLAIEAAEGTDGMLERIVELRRTGRIKTAIGRGVLVKGPKRGQDLRFDLPTIGARTVDGVVRAGLAGLAVVAGSTIVAEPEAVIKTADQAGIFVVGVPGTG